MQIGVSLGVAAGRRPGGVVPPIAVPGLLASGRLYAMGFNGSPASNGTNISQNYRLAFWNETGATITKLRVYHSGWVVTATNEAAHANALTIRGSVEYPASTRNQILWASSPAGVVPVDADLESDEITLTTPIPPDTQFWINGAVSCSAGQTWPTCRVVTTGNGEAVQQSTSIEDLTMTGGIVNQGSVRTYGPTGMKATGWTGSIRRVALAGIGDSITAGATDGNYQRGNTGWLGRATSLRCPFINLGVSGTTAQANAGNMTRRLGLLTKIGVTHVNFGYAVNDLIAGRTLGQIQADALALWTAAAAAGLKVTHSTCTPRTTGTWATLEGQTIPTTPTDAFISGGSVAASRRALWNAYLRTKPAPLFDVLDVADSQEPSRNDGRWAINAAWANDAYTTDGLHPSVTALTGQSANTASVIGAGEGGVFPMRDAAIPYIDGWLA